MTLGFDSTPPASALIFSPIRAALAKKTTLELNDQQTGKDLIFGMFRRTRPENVCARLAPEHANRRIRRLVRQRDQRNYDSDEDSLRGPQQDHASESGPGPRQTLFVGFRE